MAEVRKTVGVYERPQKRVGVRMALLGAAVAVAALGTAAALYFSNAGAMPESRHGPRFHSSIVQHRAIERESPLRIELIRGVSAGERCTVPASTSRK